VIGYEFGIISPPFIPNPAPGLGAEVSKVFFLLFELNNFRSSADNILRVTVSVQLFKVMYGHENQIY